ncbi:hypothetical protein AKJ47_01365 [candidate division MSBL1 archaeon SCGC-AAA261G05]|uniref:Metalloenzyme domain-containing protein n=1 Tax=candidate division MSBL1 archaeon SCGC-AAA261G05 TaxID=1698276 RepID=A0A133VBW2_9EURY|nr:hypothetical protein AKJ47_01365 [candidate division MSBL1 archaeon SCGC-AAA261G05]
MDVSDFDTLLTPTIWASFITGEPPEKHGVGFWWRASDNDFIDSIVHWVKYNVPLIKDFNPKLLEKLGNIAGLKDRTPNKKDLNDRGLSTIFDQASNPIALFIPSYNEPTEIRRRYREALNESVSAYERELWRVHRERVRAIFENINSEWDLFMVWLDIADQIGHIHDYESFKGRIKFMKTYFSLNNLVGQIKKALDEEVIFMIVSDHGTDLSPEGHHLDEAFFSINQEVAWEPNTILDYSPFVKGLLKELKER